MVKFISSLDLGRVTLNTSPEYTYYYFFRENNGISLKICSTQDIFIQIVLCEFL